MNQTTDQQCKFYYKTPITILTIISIVLSFLDLLLEFRLMDDISFFSVFDIVSKILFLIYILKFFKENKAAILLPTVFALVAVRPLLSSIFTIGDYISYQQGDLFFMLVPDIILVIALIFAAIRASKGLSGENNGIAMAIGIVLIFRLYLLIAVLVDDIYYISNEMRQFLFINATFHIASIVFYLALFLFVLKNRTSPVILPTLSEMQKMNRKIRTEKRQVDNLSPEQSLRLLKEKLELGLITEEEYQSQRTEIISKL